MNERQRDAVFLGLFAVVAVLLSIIMSIIIYG